jgi:hypothetical protein
MVACHFGVVSKKLYVLSAPCCCTLSAAVCIVVVQCNGGRGIAKIGEPSPHAMLSPEPTNVQEGRLIITKVASVLLCLTADVSVGFGMLKAKVRRSILSLSLSLSLIPSHTQTSRNGDELCEELQFSPFYSLC